MTKNRKVYSKSFKQKAVELANVRGNVQEISRELDVGAELIYRWRREQNTDPSLAFSGNGNKQLSAEQKELEKLRKELADVRMERDILKKAVSIFSKSDSRSTSS